MKEAEVIGLRIRILRVQRKMTQVELASLLGCSQPDLSSWENGKTLIPMKYFLKLPKIFQVNMDYFDPEKSVSFDIEQI